MALRVCKLLISFALAACAVGCRSGGAPATYLPPANSTAEQASATPAVEIETASAATPIAEQKECITADVEPVAWQSFDQDVIVSPIVGDLTGPHSVEEYVSFALSQNAEIQMARQQARAAAYKVPQAASLSDPMLGVTYAPEPVQTAAGEQRFIVTASQRLPLGGKLSTAASAAQSEALSARAKLAATELRVVEEVKRAYYDLYYYEQAIAINEQMRSLLEELSRTLEERLRAGAGAVRQHDVLQAQLEVTGVDDNLIMLRQQREATRSQLARLLHVSPETPLATVPPGPAERLPRDLERLYGVAVAMRPELHAQLFKVQADRRRIDLARLSYVPDVTASATWMDVEDEGISPVANGRDPWLVGINMNIPIYRRRIEAGIHEAEANASASARQYDVLRDRALNEVRDLLVQAESQRELYELLRDEAVPRADQTLQVAVQEYEVGGVDFLQFVDNWRDLLRYRLAQQRAETQLRQTLASLERALGGQRPGEASREIVPLPPVDADALPPPAPPAHQP